MKQDSIYMGNSVHYGRQIMEIKKTKQAKYQERAVDQSIENLGEIAIFNNEDGSVHVQVDAVNETIWLNQKGIAELFGKSTSTINEHINKIYLEGELSEENTMRKFGISEFSTKPTNFYNLDVIIAVGYRVNSKRATAFRIWATKILKEYMVKGFALDDERFKQGHSLSHFKELIERTLLDTL